MCTYLLSICFLSFLTFYIYFNLTSREGKWEEVTIDDRFPCGGDGRPVFGHCKDPEEISFLPLSPLRHLTFLFVTCLLLSSAVDFDVV